MTSQSKRIMHALLVGCPLTIKCASMQRVTVCAMSSFRVSVSPLKTTVPSSPIFSLSLPLLLERALWEALSLRMDGGW